ncbi:nucleotidyltransferase domain-containing protein [Lentzea sp. NPDC051213]|uniref:nucleotidyltransferase domain-containing protein n=1 Tax=Lentzea sp. NPDC051213 TaxID=3364126 RepID=UPI0037B87A66
MTAEDVLEILAALRGTDVWIGGGWGVDALVGRQTRPHDDLDLMHREEQEPRVVETLAALGFAETLSWRPVRFVLADAAREIDLHPLRFAVDGSAEQSSLTPGEPFRYPASCFVTGTILGTEVPCLSAEQQVYFHQGYEPRERDLHDLAQLRKLGGGRV